MHEHDHKCEGCKHDCLHYCDCCNKVYCCKCKMEWTGGYQCWYQPWATTTWPLTVTDTPYGGTATYIACDDATTYHPDTYTTCAPHGH